MPAALSSWVLRLSKDKRQHTMSSTALLPSKGKCLFTGSLTLMFQFMPNLFHPPIPCTTVTNPSLTSSKSHRYKKTAIRPSLKKNPVFLQVEHKSVPSAPSRRTSEHNHPFGPLVNLLQFVDTCCTGPKLDALV